MSVPLPTFEDISEKINNSEDLTAIECFIYNNEPVGDDEILFRTGLQSALDEAYTMGTRGHQWVQ